MNQPTKERKQAALVWARRSLGKPSRWDLVNLVTRHRTAPPNTPLRHVIGLLKTNVMIFSNKAELRTALLNTNAGEKGFFSFGFATASLSKPVFKMAPEFTSLYTSSQINMYRELSCVLAADFADDWFVLEMTCRPGGSHQHPRTGTGD